MLDKEIKIKVKYLIWAIIFVSIFLVYSFWPTSTYFTFEIEETGEKIDGKVFFDEILIGSTKDGKIKITQQEVIPQNISFEGGYNGSNFKFLYKFPVDYLDYSENPFVVSKSYLEKTKDNFPNTNEEHWGHMPLTYNYDSVCKESFNGRAIKQIEWSLSYISQKTDNVITFIYTNDSNPDLMYLCDYDDPPNNIYEEELLGETFTYFYEFKPNLYSKAEIKMYTSFYSCSEVLPAIHIHETLHALGVDHPLAPYPHDIMAAYYLSLSKECNLELVRRDVDYLLKIYGNSSS